jgi:hypothetical protein
MELKKIFLSTLLICLVFVLNTSAQQGEKIDQILAKKIEYNKNNQKSKGYKIQLYNGNETTAYRIKGNFEAEFGMVAVIKPQLPDWKVQVGNYKTRLEADRALLSIREKFVGAFILETEIHL